MAVFKFSVGEHVVTDYNGKRESLVVKGLVHQPVEYEGVMPNLYEMSNGQVLKEFYLQKAPTGEF